MKKIMLFIFTFGIIFTLYNKKAFAYTLNELKSMYPSVAYFPNPTYKPEFYWEPYVVVVADANIVIQPDGKLAGMTGDQFTYINWYTFADLNGNSNGSGTGTPFKPLYPLIQLQGNLVNKSLAEGDIYESEEDYENNNPWTPPSEASWWDDLKQWLYDETFVDGISEFMYNFWNFFFGEEPEQTNEIVTVIPSPTPLPSPIPYQTIIVPDGNGGYTFNYNYNDPNTGQPTTAPEPPEYNINWPSPKAILIPISGSPITDTDSVQEVINAIGEQDGEYMKGIEKIGQSFSTLPVKWFGFLGIPAAIIIIAGIIKSLLG